jgi:hypothetical protein
LKSPSLLLHPVIHTIPDTYRDTHSAGYLLY